MSDSQPAAGFPLSAREIPPHVVEISRRSYAPGEAFTSHAHESLFQVQLVYQGRGELRLGEHQLTLHEGSLAFIPPRIPHSLHAAEKANLDVAFIKYQLPGEMLPVEDLPTTAQHASHPVTGEAFPGFVLPQPPSRVRDLFDGLLAEAHQPDVAGALMRRALTLELMALVERRFKPAAAVNDPLIDRAHAPDRTDLSRRRMVEQAIRFIQTHHACPLTLEQIAEAVLLSTSHFRTIFREETGLSPMQYVIRYRIETAKRLLLDPQTTVQQVARKVGYRNVQHFTRIFRQHAGYCPSEIRE